MSRNEDFYFVKRETFCLVIFVIKNFDCFILRLKSVTDFGLLGRYIVLQMLFYIFSDKVTLLKPIEVYSTVKDLEVNVI